MAPYRYDRPENAAAGTIGDLLLRRGDIEANRAIQIANANARATEASGQAWAGAARGVGDAVAGTIAQATDPRRKLEAIQLQEAQQKVGDLKALDTAFATPGGRDEILNRLPGHLRPTVQKQFQDADESAAKLQETQLAAETATGDYVNTLAEGIKAHNFDPSAAQLALAHAKQTFRSNPSLLQQVGQLEQQIQQNPTPDAIKALVEPIMAAHDANEKPVVLPSTPRGGAPAQLVKPSSGAVVATGSPAAAEPPTEAQLAMQASGGDPAAAMDRLKPKPVDATQIKDVLLDNKPAQVMIDPKKPGTVTDLSGKAIDNPAARIKPIPSASAVAINAGTLSDAAMEQAARKYLETGELPPGFGTAGTIQKTAIMNYAAKLDPTAALARNKAVYKADSANLTNLQKTEGTLSAFESTAGKNLDQFLTLANKIPDTGVPWLNTPVRMLNKTIVGSENMAAIDAARDVALREIARVTNDPKMSGALTDSARQEIQSLSPQNATLPQIKAVVKVLKQDMQNVHSGLNEQIAAVKNGLAQHPGATTAPAAAGGDVIYARDPQGQLHQAKKGTPLPAGWKEQAQ